MLHFLPAPLRGAVTLLLYTLNTIGCFAAMSPIILLKVILVHEKTRIFLTRGLVGIATAWVSINGGILRLTQKIRIELETGDENPWKIFSPRNSYLVISNHRSWADILLLQHVFNRRIPFLKFFLKKELIWVPLLGVAWWALDFPFMKRYSRQYLEKHPEKKGTDMETTRRYCEKFRHSPISVINFLEGTRFDHQKHEKQQSPFRHLLKPRAGGIGIVLSSMGEKFSGIIDVTLVYPKNKPPVAFWEFLQGKISVAVIHIRTYPVPEKFAGKNYEKDEAFKQAFQEWINGLWGDKDETIEDIMNRYGE